MCLLVEKYASSTGKIVLQQNQDVFACSKYVFTTGKNSFASEICASVKCVSNARKNIITGKLMCFF